MTLFVGDDMIGQWWRDWRRGYTDKDCRHAVLIRLCKAKPGQITFVTEEEMRAISDLARSDLVRS